MQYETATKLGLEDEFKEGDERGRGNHPIPTLAVHAQGAEARAVHVVRAKLHVLEEVLHNGHLQRCNMSEEAAGDQGSAITGMMYPILWWPVVQ